MDTSKRRSISQHTGKQLKLSRWLYPTIWLLDDELVHGAEVAREPTHTEIILRSFAARTPPFRRKGRAR